MLKEMSGKWKLCLFVDNSMLCFYDPLIFVCLYTCLLEKLPIGFFFLLFGELKIGIIETNDSIERMGKKRSWHTDKIVFFFYWR